MNTPESTSSSPEQRDAAERLEQLRADRARLDERTRPPSWVAPTLAVVGGAYVAAPALGGQDWQRSNFVVLLVAVIVVLEVARRQTGRRDGARSWQDYGLLGLLAIALLALLSVSLGLVSLGHAVWVILPTLAGAGATWAVIRHLQRRSAEAVRG